MNVVSIIFVHKARKCFSSMYGKLVQIVCTVVVISLLPAFGNTPQGSTTNKNAQVGFVKPETERPFVSIIAIIGNPSHYHNKEIVITGLISSSDHDITIISYSRDAILNNVSQDCIFIDHRNLPSYEARRRFMSKTNDRWCRISGLVDANRRGPDGREYYACVLVLKEVLFMERLSPESAK